MEGMCAGWERRERCLKGNFLGNVSCCMQKTAEQKRMSANKAM